MKITSTVLNPASLKSEESVFHTANGYLGVRACFEEGYPGGVGSVRGCYINGFYDTVAIEYPEKLFGFPETAQRMVNLPDTQTTRLFLDGEELSPFRGNHSEYRRELDMESGVALRSFKLRTSGGKEVRVTFRRMTSFVSKELFFTQIAVEGIGCSGRLEAVSECECAVSNYFSEYDPRVASSAGRHIRMISASTHGTGRASVTCETAGSRLSVATAMGCRANRGDVKTSFTASGFKITLTLDYGEEPAVVEKYCAYSDSLRHSGCLEHAVSVLDKSMFAGASQLFAQQKAYLDGFWRKCGVKIHGNGEIAEGMAFNMYGLLQGAGCDGIGNIAAKGLSGEGYEGHYFWDTEIYMLPFFLFTWPERAKALLSYRHSILDAAREHARLLGHGKGALYAWRTITGGECSPYFPSGSAQYHINGDIAHAFLQYFAVTGDVAFMAEKGAEVLVETARLWIDAGHYDRRGRLCFFCVTGPDEYTCVVNNNYYTNLAAKRNLLGAARVCKALKREGFYKPLAEKLRLADKELAEFEKAAGDIYIPYDERLDINPQDDSFLDKPKWDLAATPKENFPILAHYHPLCMYRHQLCKQADVVLAHLLFEEAGESTMKNSFDYYESITSHDSTLSACVFSAMASRLNMPEKAYDYFLRAVRTDLDDAHGNTADGLHAANMGGAYLALTAGFAGLRIREDGPHFRFTLPKQWTGYEFRLKFSDSLLRISVKGKDAAFTLESGEPVIVFVDGVSYKIKDTLPVVGVVR